MSQEVVTELTTVEERDSGELMTVTSQPQTMAVMGLMSEHRPDRGTVLTEEIGTVERVTNMTGAAVGILPADNRSIIFVKKVFSLTLYWFHFSYLLLFILLLTTIMCV